MIKNKYLLTNCLKASFNIEATRSLSYQQEAPIAPNDTVIVLKPLGTFFDSGEIFESFQGNLNFPEAIKSK